MHLGHPAPIVHDRAMYTPTLFKIDDIAEAHALMRAAPFCILVTTGSDGLTATHVPVVLKADAAEPLGRLDCHLARPNSQWRTFAPDTEALAIFQGPEAYIRPGWYPSKAEHGKVVPTWNYAVVHAYGRLEAHDDKAWLLAHVDELTRQQETPLEAPWSTADAPPSFLDAMARGIVGLTLRITRLEGKAKMSQNRDARDRAGVIAGLSNGDADDRQVAALVEKLYRRP
jgi:transcriptional regulator